MPASRQLMRGIRVQRPLMPLDAGALGRQGAAGEKAAGGPPARLAAVALHEKTMDFCGIGTSVTLTSRARGAGADAEVGADAAAAAEPAAALLPRVGPGVYENLSARRRDHPPSAAGRPVLFDYASDGKRWRIVDVHSSSADDTGDLLCECERVRDEPLEQGAGAGAAAAAAAEDELAGLVESLDALKRPVHPDVWKYMPADGAADGGYLSSHHEVAVWTGAARRRRLRRRTRALSVRDEHRKAGDPYRKVADSVDASQSWRRELFSFACADLCELSDIERIALLSQFATVGRLEFLSSRLAGVLGRARAEQAIRG